MRDISAHRCDADHSLAAAEGGETSLNNLALLCRRHHVMKHAAAWSITHQGHGVLEWTSPSGRTYVDTPTPTLRFFPTGPDDPGHDPNNPGADDPGHDPNGPGPDPGPGPGPDDPDTGDLGLDPSGPCPDDPNSGDLDLDPSAPRPRRSGHRCAERSRPGCATSALASSAHPALAQRPATRPRPVPHRWRWEHRGCSTKRSMIQGTVQRRSRPTLPRALPALR